MKPLLAWCGFSEGKPHVYWQDGERVIAVYKTKAAAKRCYEDHRRIKISLIGSRKKP